MYLQHLCRRPYLTAGMNGGIASWNGFRCFHVTQRHMQSCCSGEAAHPTVLQAHSAQDMGESSVRRRHFTTNNSDSSSADVVSGPRLLRTSVRHRPRPSLLHLPGLRALPFWTALKQDGETQIAYRDATVTKAVQYLEMHCADIVKEYQIAANQVANDYQSDTEHFQLHEGNWEWRSYLRQGRVEPHFATAFPFTASVLQQLHQQDLLFDGTPFGYAFFSTLHAQSRIQPHTAPMNLRLRVHLPLQVPTAPATAAAASTAANNSNNTSDHGPPACGIRVGSVTREWTVGKGLVLDDCFEHEVWNNTNEPRVLLLVDLWHPDVTAVEKEEIRNMFRDAQDKGWLS